MVQPVNNNTTFCQSVGNFFNYIGASINRVGTLVASFFCCCKTPTTAQPIQNRHISTQNSTLEENIVKECKDKGRITLNDLQNKLSAERETLKTALRALVSRNLLTQNGNGRDTYYTPGSGQPVNKPSVEEAFKQVIKESELEKKIVEDAEWIEGAKEGVVRPGHPEGQIVYHVIEVLKNVDTWCKDHNATAETRSKLRVIAMIHDTFKHKVNRNAPRTGENHHAMIARRFAERIGIQSSEILEIIEHHDDAYNAWQAGGRNGDWQRADAKAKKLLATLDSHSASRELYTAFYWCDSKTGDKTSEPFDWWVKNYSQPQNAPPQNAPAPTPTPQPAGNDPIRDIVMRDLQEANGPISIKTIQDKHPELKPSAEYRKLRTCFDALVAEQKVQKIGHGPTTTYKLK